MSYRALPPLLLAVLLPAGARAQCPDGTPPPCGVAMRTAPARAEAPPPGQRGRSFLVLPFRNVTRSQEHAWLEEGSPALLSDALAQWEEVSVVPPERLYPALRRHGLEAGEVMGEEEIRRVAEETRGWTAVTGEVLATGGRIRISARAYDVVTRAVVVRATEEVDADGDIRVAYDRLAGQLLRTAGLEAEEGPRLAATTTASLDAYRAYLRGMRHYNRGEMEQAQEHFLEAVEEDSTFAQAYAKLASASMNTVDALQDPASPGYRYAERAARLANRLPPRERALVLATTAVLRGQLGEARGLLEEVVAADSNDVEALEDLAGIHLLDALVVEGPGGRPARRGSYNEVVRLAKRALTLDPARHSNYGLLLVTYAGAAGWGGGRAVGIGEEAPNLLALLQAQLLPDVQWALLMGEDSLELVPADSFASLPRSEVRAARERAARTAVAWTERWLAAAPDASAAHRWAATVFEVVGEPERALRELHVADSLGVEFELEESAGRRMILLFRAGRGEEALALADSLREAGSFDVPLLTLTKFQLEHAAWALIGYLTSGRLEAAMEIVQTTLDRFVPVFEAQGVTDPDIYPRVIACHYLCRGGVGSFSVFLELPDSARVAALEALLPALPAREPDLLSDIAGPAVVAATVPSEAHPLGGPVSAPRDVRRRLSELALETAVAAREAGRSGLARDLAAAVIDVDTTAAARLAAFDVLRALTDAEPGALYLLGRIAALTGERLDEGEESLELYLDAEGVEMSDARRTWVHVRLGQIAEHRGEDEDAREAYRRALEIDPDHESAAEALERLEGGEG